MQSGRLTSGSNSTLGLASGTRWSSPRAKSAMSTQSRRSKRWGCNPARNRYRCASGQVVLGRRRNGRLAGWLAAVEDCACACGAEPYSILGMRSRLRRWASWRKARPLQTVDQQFVKAAEAWFARDESRLRWCRPRLAGLEIRPRPVPTISLVSEVPHSIVTLYLAPSNGGYEVRASFEYGFVPPHVSPWPPPPGWDELTRRICAPPP
jgi:hypothetical protein